MMYGWDYGSGYGIWSFLSMLFTLGVVAVGVILVIRLATRGSGAHLMSGFRDTPLDTLKRRYANGEIDKKEYEEKRKDLSE
ncbi:MAG TPA: SHOCT domain-containing protein [Candidatus Saccharimonadales bacterium]|nr:SHOCT domain-containing protein [Candidatus Saccharimonadales bacterium]